MIQLNNFKKSYGSMKALQSVTVTFKSDKIIGIGGDNSNGKSTLLKLMARISKNDSASILFDRKPVSRKAAVDIAYLSDVDIFLLFHS